MRIQRTFFALLSILLLQVWGTSQTSSALPRSNPEAEGVASEGITQFLEAFTKSNHELHGFMMLRHGKVVAEGWSHPYRADLKHTMYSCSKSFTATAIGFAVSEKRLAVTDKVISFFPDDLPASISPNLAELRVRDLLSMSAGQEPDPTFNVISKDSNWVRAFLATPIVHTPGTKFLYNTLATYMLSAILQKITGEKLLDYLTPRLFQPLGITGIDWETDPRGIDVGGWGLRLKTEDMAKFAQLFLQKGKWNGRQILPAAWVEEASSLKIVQHPDLAQSKKDSSDWEQGYCYQMWRSRNNSYRGDGAYGQFILVWPDQDAVFVLTSESYNMQDEFNYIWKYVFPAIRPGKLPANKTALTALHRKLHALALPLSGSQRITGATDAPTRHPSTLEKDISGKMFSFSSNDLLVQSIGFQFNKDLCMAVLKIGADTFQLPFGARKWAYGQTSKRPPALTQWAKGYFVGLPASEIAGAYRWIDENTLELTLRYLESPHAELITCHFEKNNLTLHFQNSREPNDKQVLNGMMGN